MALVVSSCGSGIDSKPKQGVSIETNNTTPASDAGVSDGGDIDMSETVPDATMSSQDAPTIIELDTSPRQISEGQSVTVSAVVSDPQGVDDIAAGRLLDSQNGQLIGNFRQISGGSYELQITWSDLDLVRTITFGPNGGQRAVTAEFIDLTNERSTRSVTIGLTCEGDSACEGSCGLELCDGVCQDPRTDYDTEENCGGCGISCGADEYCEAGICETVPESTLGNACSDEPDCEPDFSCFNEQAIGIPIPGGYCTKLCETSNGCGAGGACIPYDPQGGSDGVPLCGETCATASDCRSGYDCVTFETVEGTFESVCIF